MFKIRKNLRYILLSSLFGITYLLWFVTKFAIEKNFNISQGYLYLSQLLALTAVLLFTINFTLATRSYFIESLFGGLDKMYKFHKMVARFAFTFAWAHPILLVIQAGFGIESLRVYFIPDTELRFNLGMGALYLMSLLVLFALTKYLPYHIWKNTHRFMVLVMLFLFFHIITAPGPIADNIILKIWIIFWVCFAIACWIYVEFVYRKFGPVFYYKLVSSDKKNEINELFLEPQNKPIIYKPGQYVFISFTDNKKIGSELHPFAISSNPHDYSIRISAKTVGDYTKRLVDAKNGDIVKLIGPYGYFVKDRFADVKNQIWIAGGIGITPFLSMLAVEKDEPSGNNINFFYTNKSEEEAVYKDEVLKNAENVPNLKINFNYDKVNGYLNVQKVIEKVPNAKECTILLCGPKGMMYSLRKQFIDSGFSDKQIIFEDFALKPV